MKLRLVETQIIKEEDYQTTAYKNIISDVFEGTDFLVGNIDINDEGIDFDVTAFGPDGEMNRQVHLPIPSYEEQIRNACEQWMSDHSTPDVFYEKEELDKEEFFNLYKYMDSYQGISKYKSPDELKKFLDSARAKNYDHPVAGGIGEKDYEILLNYANEWQKLIDNCGYESTIKDSEESDATQTEDIAKKEEYKELVTPTFKVGKKISLDK